MILEPMYPAVLMVTKIRADGSPCPKCLEVKQRLRELGLSERVQEVIADERDPNSAGMLLAAQHQIAIAPFFVVKNRDISKVYTVFMRLLREVLQVEKSTTNSDRDLARQANDTLRSHPELDFV